MKFIKITTPDGREHIVPEEHNKVFYENMNISLEKSGQRDKMYKIEPFEPTPVEPKVEPTPVEPKVKSKKVKEQ